MIPVAMLAGVAVMCCWLAIRPSRIADRVSVYLELEQEPTPDDALSPDRLPIVLWGCGGATVGVLAAQGDLFLSGAGRSAPALAVLGAIGALMVRRARLTTLADRRVRRLRFELPVIADALAMHVVTGESVATAIRNVHTSTTGVARDELAAVLERTEAGEGLRESLAEAARTSIHADGSRLYESLAHAHAVGGRLTQVLTDLAEDFRAALERDITSESGKRAIAAYGPVLALMVPTSLLFLLYPTLLGLKSLSGAP